jgi:myosin-18
MGLSDVSDGDNAECLYLLQLADAFEEVEEQRQVVGQWKRKAQKLTAETSDLRLLLEEQNSRNHLLEKKQRK